MDTDRWTAFLLLWGQREWGADREEVSEVAGIAEKLAEWAGGAEPAVEVFGASPPRVGSPHTGFSHLDHPSGTAA